MIKEIKIQIAGKEYLIKKTYRSLLLFEDETGRNVTEMKQSLKDLLMLFYCIVKANNELSQGFYEFVDMIDGQPNVMDKFNAYLVDSATTVEEPQVKKKRASHSK